MWSYFKENIWDTLGKLAAYVVTAAVFIFVGALVLDFFSFHFPDALPVPHHGHPAIKAFVMLYNDGYLAAIAYTILATGALIIVALVLFWAYVLLSDLFRFVFYVLRTIWLAIHNAAYKWDK
jgi:hypothetical protein